MLTKLSKEVSDALQAAGDGSLEAIDPETGRIYFVVEGDIHRRAMMALQQQQATEAIANGIADLEAGRTQPVEDVHAQIRQQLQSPTQG